MAQNWPPAPGSYPAWPPSELGYEWLSFDTLQTAIDYFTRRGWARANPTAAENQAFFRQVRCDHNDPCSGVMLVSPGGTRYPFAYCTGADHKSALVLWPVGYSGTVPAYDLGWGSGVLIG